MKHVPIVVLLALSIGVIGCGSDAPEWPTMTLEGSVKIRAEIDSTTNYSGFELLVYRQLEGEDADTLGIATTDTTGYFMMEISVPERGVYPLLISRYGTPLHQEEMAVVAGDAATVDAVLPTAAPLRIRSAENVAWVAYRNTRAQHQRSLNEVLTGGTIDPEAIRRTVEATSTIYTSLARTFPGTMGAEVASAESVIMLAGWNDAMALERLDSLSIDNVRIVDVLRAARRAAARESGLESGLALLEGWKAKTDDQVLRAAIQSEQVLALIDSLQQDRALIAARDLRAQNAGAGWDQWADNAIYELENLMPGMIAPDVVVRTYPDSALVETSSLRGKLVLLEFYAPGATSFEAEIAQRNEVIDLLDPRIFASISVSVDPDTLRNEAYIDSRQLLGQHVIAPDGLRGDLASLYNVNVLPTRYLLDADGRIAGKYTGRAMERLVSDLALMLNAQ